MALLLLIGFGLRVICLTVDRFHADEALYAGWALLILDGDLSLLSVPVDKPPFYLYALAGSIKMFGPSETAARMPSLAASVLGIALTYRLGKRLYGRSTGLWAALFVAMSPYDILFARTAFTDPTLVGWTLGALCAVAEGRWLWAGLCLGMAFATKQHVVLMIPLVVAMGWIVRQFAERARETWPGRLAGLKTKFSKAFLAGILGFAVPFGLVVAWDAMRWSVRPGYWKQSAMSYGGLAWAAHVEWGERFTEWLSWARYLAGSPVLNLLLVLGSMVLLAWGWRRQPRERGTWLDTLFATFAVGYLIVHTVVEFSIWDRYLLPLVPLLGLLLGRIVVQGRKRLEGWKVGRLQGVLAMAVCLAALLPGWKAAHNGYPVGGDHWAYQGLDKVVAYLKQSAPPDAVLYHHWLRWHYTYYLHDTNFELRWWQSGEHLRREALRTPERAQYIVLPDWHTLESDAYIHELDVEGVCLHPADEYICESDVYIREVYKVRRQDGSVSMRVYKIELQTENRPGFKFLRMRTSVNLRGNLEIASTQAGRSSELEIRDQTRVDP